jgi:hypothetical protein
MALTRIGLNQSINLASNVTGTLPTGNGGTGATSFAPAKVLQVVQDTKLDTSYIQSTSFTDIGLSASITPSSSSNKVLVTVMLVGVSDHYFARGRLMRDTTEIAVPTAASNRPNHALNFAQEPSVNGEVEYLNCTFLDTPNSSSSLTYKIQVASRSDNASQGCFINRSDADRDAIHDGRNISTITLFEIAG